MWEEREGGPAAWVQPLSVGEPVTQEGSKTSQGETDWTTIYHVEYLILLLGKQKHASRLENWASRECEKMMGISSLGEEWKHVDTALSAGDLSFR